MMKKNSIMLCAVMTLILVVLGRWKEAVHVGWLLQTANVLVTIGLSSIKGLHINLQDEYQRVCWRGLIFGAWDFAIWKFFDVDYSSSWHWNVTITFISMTSVLVVIRWSKLTRNECEIFRIMDRNPNIGADMAMTNFRFLENVIKGKKEKIIEMNGSEFKGNGSFIELINQYMKNEMVSDSSYFPKLLILFPEYIFNDSPITEQMKETIFGSVGDVLQAMREADATHTLTTENINYSFKASGGMPRNMQLEVLKSRKISENGEIIFNYLAFAENRPLKTLYMMVADPLMKFSQHNFNIQFEIYKRELGKLLDADPKCKDRYLILHYRHLSGAFTKEINKLVNSGQFIKPLCGLNPVGKR